MSESSLLLADDHLVADFPYDAGQVKEIKTIAGAKWDKVSRVWRLPMTSINDARRFADRHGFYIDPEVLTFTVPQRPPARVRLEDGHLVVNFEYDRVKIETIRQINDVTFDNQTKRFFAPVDQMESILAWAERFGIEVDSAVVELAQRRGSEASGLFTLSGATDAELELPELPGELRAYQKAGIAYMLETRRCFLADEMGTGKTIQSLVALEMADAFPAVVVCPATLTLNWAAEAHKWLPHRSVHVVSGRKDEITPADLTVVGWSNLSPRAIELAGATSYIFDESHYAKNPTAQRTKAAVKLAKGAPGLVLCLTGTPVTNRPAEFAPQLEILGRLEEFGGKWNFYKRFCGAFRDKWGHWHTDGASNTTELHDRLRSSCYVRRTKDQVLDELPPMLDNHLLVIPDAKIMKDYRKAEDDIVEYMVRRATEIALELGVSPKSAAVRARMAAESNEHLVRLSALRRLAALAKMGAVTEWVESMLEEDKKVVLAAHHRDVVDELATRFGGFKIQGGMSVEDVEDAKSRFQNDPDARVITLSIQAAKTGHTLTAAQDICFVELPFTPADLDQTAARCHRMGQRGIVTAHRLLAAGTIDERLDDLISMKREIVNAVTDGSVRDNGRRSEGVAAALTLEYAGLGD